jgi:hypothetical protein
MIVVLAMAALAIDLGMLIKTRAEAQRTADAAALAGVSAFQFGPLAAAQVQPAITQALRLAANNYVDGSYVDTTGQTQQVIGQSTWAYTSEATVEVRPDIPLVRVTIRRPNVGTWFAEVLNIQLVPVLGRAAAVASASGAVQCLKPFAIPDRWDERSTMRSGGPYFETGDTDGDRVWDSNENWAFDPPSSPYAGTDYYEAYDPNVVSATQNGFGSAWRDGGGITSDYGRQLIIKAQRPTDNLGPGFFYPFQIDGTAGGGANVYENDIINCNPLTVTLGQPYPIEAGNMVGKTNTGINELMALDPGAQWDAGTGQVIGSNQGSGWGSSKRVITVALFDPHQIIDIHDGGHTEITFNNFAVIFLEGFGPTTTNPPNPPVIARFLWFGSGVGGGGPTTGPLTRILQLVE